MSNARSTLHRHFKMSSPFFSVAKWLCFGVGRNEDHAQGHKDHHIPGEVALEKLPVGEQSLKLKKTAKSFYKSKKTTQKKTLYKQFRIKQKLWQLLFFLISWEVFFFWMQVNSHGARNGGEGHQDDHGLENGAVLKRAVLSLGHHLSPGKNGGKSEQV